MDKNSKPCLTSILLKHMKNSLLIKAIGHMALSIAVAWKIPGFLILFSTWVDAASGSHSQGFEDCVHQHMYVCTLTYVCGKKHSLEEEK